MSHVQRVQAYLLAVVGGMCIVGLFVGVFRWSALKNHYRLEAYLMAALLGVFIVGLLLMFLR